MPILTFKCPACNSTKEVLQKFSDKAPLCPHPRTYADGYEDTFYQVMNLVPSVPSPMQWGCSRGF